MSTGPPSWHRVREVFDEVAALPPADRAGRLRGLCGDDSALQLEVESLLAHDGADGEPVVALLQREARELADEAWLVPGATVLHYDIVAQVGEGASGAVWHAVDRSLARDVAIKVLPSAVARDPVRLGRFEREARVLATLNHPNIATVHSVHEVDGHRFIVMEFVDGDDLATRLSRGRLSAPEAVGLAGQIADGLVEAHARGIVHRDLKPANVKVKPSGQVKVLDFGLAKVFDVGETRRLAPRSPAGAPEESASALATSSGAILGTAAYMAPEQARGEHVDTGADIWACGAMLFEMVSGRRPFAGASVGDAMAAILHQEPAWQLLPPETPRPLVNLIRQCLVKDVEHRLRTASDLQREIRAIADVLEPTRRGAAPQRAWWRRGVLVAAAVALAALGSLAVWRGGTRVARPTTDGNVVLAVLPFENLGASENDYFAEGVTDEVRGKLVEVPGLRVIARASSIRYRKSALLLPELGRELGAAYLLTATVRWDKREAGSDRVRVSPELVEAATGATLWQQPFDAEMSDVFDVQTQIATRVAQALDLALATGDRERLDRRPTSDVTAYEAYLEGNAATDGMVSQAPVDLREAAAHYGRAVALDPEFALAWAQLSRVHSQLYSYGGLAPNDRDQARRAAERALVLAPALGVAHLALGNYFDLIEQNWQKALEQYALGRQGEPRNVELLSAAAQAQQRLGLWQESVATLELARSLDPRSAVAARNLARVLLRLRRYDDARAAVEDGLRLAPHSLDLLEFKAMVALARGDLKTARSVVANAAREQGQAAVVAYFATYWDLFWVLDSDEQELLLELSPEAFDNDRMSWAITHAEVAALRGDAAKTRLYAEAARAAADEQLASAPNDAQRHAFLGLALAYLGRTTDAVREGERAVALMPVTRDASAGAYLQHQLARIYVLAGEHEKAIDTLERLLAIPYFVSPAWLRIDPAFAALLGHPRFERLSRANGG